MYKRQGVLKNIVFKSSQLIQDLVLIVASIYEGRLYVMSHVSKQLVENKGLDAREINKKICVLIDGSGGGQSFFSSASSTNVGGLQDVLKKSKKFVFNR